MNLIMMKVGSSGSKDVAGGTAGDSPNISSGGSAEDNPATLSAGQDDVEAVACGSHPREMSDEHVWPNLTLEENMEALHQANVCDFLLKAGANKSTIEKAKESSGCHAGGRFHWDSHCTEVGGVASWRKPAPAVTICRVLPTRIL